MNDVQEIADYAYKNVPLYQKIAKEKEIKDYYFEELPFVTKDTYVNAEVPYLSAEYVKKYVCNQLMNGKTSGSTGKITQIYWDIAEEKKSLLELWLYRKKYYDISPQDKMCYFFPINEKGPDAIENNTSLGVSKSVLFNGKLSDAYSVILQYDPVWMVLQPSIAWMLLNLVRKEDLGIPKSLRYIELTGEYLEESIRKELMEGFQCQIANQYGIREVNSIAYECPCGNMHIMRKNAFVEIVHHDGTAGDICVTSLQNRAMPYIRYITGDKGNIRKSDCLCGNCNDILELSNGRDNDWIKREDGTLIHPYALLQIINTVNSYQEGTFLQYQIIQKKLNIFQFRLVVRIGSDRKVLERKVKELVDQRLGGSNEIEFLYYSELQPDIQTGKIASFLCEC